MGAHYLPSPHPGFRGLNLLLEDLGVIMNRDGDGRPDFDPRSICAAPLERHRHLGVWDEGLYPARGQNADEEGQWIRWQAHLRELDGRLGPDGRRLFDLPVDRSSSALRHLDGISMAAYLDRLQLTSWRLRWTVDYACRDDYGCTAAQTSAYAALHHYLSRGLEGIHERTTLTWPEGNDHLVERMAAQAELGDAVLPSHAVVRIDPDEGTVHAWDLEQQRLIQIEAHVVLWSAPRFVLTRVLPPGRDPLGTGTLTYAPWLVTNIELARRPQGLGARLAWDNVPVDGQDLGYIVANHGEPATERVRPGAVLTLYEPLVATDGAGLHARRQHLLEGTLPVLAQRATDRLEALHPGIGDAIVQVDVARWGHGMIRPVPGLLFGTELATAAAPLGRILPCAADVSGLPLFEQAFSGGVRAAESALSRLGESVATIM
jgi:hypothetical protein